jgi:hypothetical protein
MIVREEEELEFWVRTTPLQWNRIAPGDRFRRPPPPPNNRTSPSQIPSSPAGAPRKQIPPGLQVSSVQLDHAWEPNNAGDKNIVGTHPFESIPLPSPSAYRIKPSFWEVQDLGADRPSSASERRSSSSGFFAGNQRDPQQWGSDLSLPDESRDRILEITGIQGKKETGTAETGHRRSEAGTPV